jgi:hypothetical protein
MFLGPWIQSLRNRNQRFKNIFHETLDLWVSGVPGPHRGLFKVTHVVFDGPWFNPKAPTKDPGFNNVVWCYSDILNATHLEEVADGAKIFSATINHQSRSGKVTSILVMGEARLTISLNRDHELGNPFLLYLFRFESRRLHVTLPPAS